MTQTSNGSCPTRADAKPVATDEDHSGKSLTSKVIDILLTERSLAVLLTFLLGVIAMCWAAMIGQGL